MCRLFGFKSVLSSQVHSSLVHADNALVSQSLKHKDGWGVAYYKENVPHLIKSVDRAIDDSIFHRVSGVVSSQTVIAHLRKATQGDLSILNSHPFQYGKWIFAHNGNLKNFSNYRKRLVDKIDESLRPFLLGTTDSEVIFYLLLTIIKKTHSLSDPKIDLQLLNSSVNKLCEIITSYSGELYGGADQDPTQNHLSFIFSSGEVLAAFNGGQDLRYSTHKKLCPDRDTCKYFNNSCESENNDGETINHLLFSSENIESENIWYKMQKGELVAVDEAMMLRKYKINTKFVDKN